MKKNLIVVPFHDFKTALNSGFNTRDAHLYEHFIKSKGFDNIVIINRPTSLAEILLRRKNIKTTKNILFKKNRTYIQKFAENVFIIDFFVFDFFKVIIKKHAWLPYIYSRRRLADKIIIALKTLNIVTYSVYMSSPFSVRLGINLKPKTKILDAVDNFAKYKNWLYFKDEIVSLYNLAKSDYDYIFVNSQDTYNYLSPGCKAKLELIPNGVDIDKFTGEFERPKDLPMGKPIIGYAGKMQRMFDTKLLSDLAKENPNLNFVIIGKFLDKKWKKQNWDKDLKNLKNIYFLGNKKYDLLPGYYNHFDICIIPYKIENQHGGDPIKFYEYMACNKPIISTNIGNIKKFHNNESIIICDTQNEFVSKFNNLIKYHKHLKIDYNLLEQISWQSIANYMSKKLFS